MCAENITYTKKKAPNENREIGIGGKKGFSLETNLSFLHER